MDIKDKIAKYLTDSKNIESVKKEYKEILENAIAYVDTNKLPNQYVQAVIIKHLFNKTKRFTLEIKDKIQCDSCSHCCYTDVDLTNIEASLIIAFIEETNTKIIFNKEIDLFKRKACPFLNKGLCQIYEVRPLICRLHNSNDSNACSKNKSHGQFSEPNILGLWAMLIENPKTELIKMNEVVEHLKTKTND